MDRMLFHETFSRLRASDEAKEEVLAMTQETKKRHTGAARVLTIAAAVVLALAVTAGAANGLTDGNLFITLSTVWSDGIKTVYEDQSGATYQTYDLRGEVEKGDGRLYLVAGEEEMDITDAMANEGSYHYETEQDGVSLVVDVTGDTERWTCTNTVTADEMTLSYSVNSWEQTENSCMVKAGDSAAVSDDSAQANGMTETIINLQD